MSLGFSEIQAILAMLGLENMSEEQVKELYDSKMSEVSALLPLLSKVAPLVAKDAVEPLRAGVVLLTEISSDPSLIEELNKFNQLRAESRMRNVNAHVEAGFKRKDAIVFSQIDAAKAHVDRKEALNRVQANTNK